MDANQTAVKTLIEAIGEDPTREGLIDTPARVVKALQQLTDGYDTKPDDILNTQFALDNASDEMVVVTDIPFNSLCEHHLLPFTGTAHVAYIPTTHVVGLSKIPRLVSAYAHRLQIQERLTTQIAHTLHNNLTTQGVAVVLQAHHQCMSLRGARSNGTMTTSCLLGEFADHHSNTRAEFLALIR